MALKNEISNINLAQVPNRMSEIVSLGKATTTDTFAQGDLIEADSQVGTCKVVNDAAGNAFIGVSMSTSLTTGLTDEICIAFYGVVEAYLASTSAAIYFGESVAWGAGANGTDWYMTKATSEAIMHCLSRTIAAGGKGYMLFDSYGTRAVTGLSFFDLPVA